MPLYEYRCRNCNHQFEVQQSFSDDALTVCPDCSGELRKVFNPVGISFKGSGFYKNDSRSSSSSSSSSAGTEGTSTSTTKESSTSTSSPDSGAGSGSADSGSGSTSTTSTPSTTSTD